eukprot:TRINITY_DN1562_c0_g2_i1.p1 TRINITY_DN1562_c0_g2~~TRINITY_DN1562_c0_g2_i1.p1  ORF type:complete len:223 (+),score=90.51 TRINITY_DN1562_c0_g2_i1:33-671(+)
MGDQPTIQSVYSYSTNTMRGAMDQGAPCPDKIFDDCGGAFAMGCAGGSVWHGFKGLRNSPRGWSNRSRGMISAIRTRAPVLGGQFAVWGGLFSVFDCGIAHVRGKHDWINSVASGAITSGLLAIRAGFYPFLLNCAVGGAMLGMLELAGAGVNHLMKPEAQQDPLLKSSFALRAEKLKEEMKEARASQPIATPKFQRFLALEDDLEAEEKFL